MRTCLWALACICIEVASACGVPAEVCESPVSDRELELELARTRDVYLKLDPRCRELGILVSGVELDSVPLAAVELLGYLPARQVSGALDPVDLPAVLTVKDDLSAASRRVVAPPVLRPYVEESAESSDPAPPAPSAGHPEPAETAPPSSYGIGLEGGWSLELRPRPVAHGPAVRVGEALRDGWARWTGATLDRPRRIVLVLAPEEARRLHHLFRAGTRILVLAPEQ